MDKAVLWAVALATLIVSFFSVNAVVNTSAETATPIGGKMVGAYYYVWYGLDTSVRNTAGEFHSNWENATSTPFVGEYVSNDSAVADTQIILARLHKIDFFAVSWLGVFDWYDHLAVDDFLQQGLLKAEHMDTFNFCIFYESEIVLSSVYNASKSNDFFERQFSVDMNYANDTYFANPSYLRIDGKPVVFMYNLPYLCQNLGTLDVHAMLVNLTLDFSNNVYLVGDVGNAPSPANVAFQLSLFSDVLNATTNYLFSSPSKGWNGIIDDARQDYPKWRANMTEEGMSFLPSAFPGYNDTKENPNSAVLPVNATEFGEFLQTARNNTDDGGITMITSWNEWKESTAIEPSVELGDLLLDIVPEFPLALVLLVTVVLATPSVAVYGKWAGQRSRCRFRQPVKHKSRAQLHRSGAAPAGT
jgi:hypothetical protein